MCTLWIDLALGAVLEWMHICQLYHREKRRVSLTRLWSPQLRLSGHLHVVIKECAHKCNPYFDPISMSDLRKESIARTSFSRFQVTTVETMRKCAYCLQQQENMRILLCMRLLAVISMRLLTVLYTHVLFIKSKLWQVFFFF